MISIAEFRLGTASTISMCLCVYIMYAYVHIKAQTYLWINYKRIVPEKDERLPPTGESREDTKPHKRPHRDTNQETKTWIECILSLIRLQY